jgi:MFS family permease
MFIDLSPLLNNKNFRHLFLGQLVSYLGTMISITVVPFQVYSLTHSSAMVGFVSAVELVPLLVGAFIGGTLADHLDRKKVLIYCEGLMALGIGVLLFNSLSQDPSVLVIFVVSAIMQAINGFHRPAMDSLGQALLKTEEIPAAAALHSFRFGFVNLFAPSLGGILISTLGAEYSYGFDLLTFLFSIWMLYLLDTRSIQRESRKLELTSSLLEGLQYAYKRQEILGTYVVDIIAMTFAFPAALFPSISQQFNRPQQVGLLYTALSIGSLAVPIYSKWGAKVQNQGKAIIIAAGAWGVAIAASGMTENFWLVLGFLVLAGFADTISAFYRSLLWNQTIPNFMRGRMAGLEMISYMSGPLLGNARAGWIASMTSNSISLVAGGALCTFGVFLVALILPKFREYQYKN